jgi:hypothetical protein
LSRIKKPETILTTDNNNPDTSVRKSRDEIGLIKTCQNREPAATSVEAEANARHVVPAVLWTIPFRQAPTSLFHATANITVGTARMSKFIAKTTTTVVVIVAFVRCRTVAMIVPARQLARTGDYTL